MRALIVGGIEIPIRASHTLGQSYDPVQAVNRIRMMNGSLIQQQAWGDKLYTSIQCGGALPAGLQMLDYSQAITIKCVAERAVTSVSNVITIPSERRSDYAPEGRALVDGKWESTPAAMGGNTATLTTIAGATQYQAIYWPELICFCDPPSETRGARNADYGWSLEAEEI